MYHNPTTVIQQTSNYTMYRLSDYKALKVYKTEPDNIEALLAVKTPLPGATPWERDKLRDDAIVVGLIPTFSEPLSRDIGIVAYKKLFSLIECLHSVGIVFGEISANTVAYNYDQVYIKDTDGFNAEDATPETDWKQFWNIRSPTPNHLQTFRYLQKIKAPDVIYNFNRTVKEGYPYNYSTNTSSHIHNDDDGSSYMVDQYRYETPMFFITDKEHILVIKDGVLQNLTTGMLIAPVMRNQTLIYYKDNKWHGKYLDTTFTFNPEEQGIDPYTE